MRITNNPFVFLALILFSPLVLAAPGDLDTTFGGGDGWVNTDLPVSSRTPTDQACAVIRQSNGKLVVGAGGTAAVHLLRYNADGSLDTSFDGDGKLVTSIGITVDEECGLIEQVDGKLVAVGRLYNSSAFKSDFAMVRYDANGSLDTGFGVGGVVQTSLRNGDYDEATSVIQQSDGKLVVAGFSQAGSANSLDFALVRYNLDGSLDTTFNTTGIVITSYDSSEDRAYAVIQQTDGKLVVSGASRFCASACLAVMRYNTDGSLDTGFSGDGIATVGSIHGDIAASQQQADGKLLVMGGDGIARYNSNGTLDNTFSGDGKLPITGVTLEDMVQEPGGKVVVAGYKTNGSNNDILVMRYNSNGTVDNTFGGDGEVLVGLGAGNDYAYEIIQLPDGKFLVAGYSASMPTGQEVVLARFEGDSLSDIDSDGIADAFDNCPDNSNVDQLNTDGDAQGNACDLDDDNDGMPDTWEQTYGLNPLVNDAAGDPDGDGFTNLQEYQNSTDPTVSDVTSSTPYDFDNDGDSDILMRNTSTGQNQILLLQNGMQTSISTLTTNATTFEVAAVLDGDNDGDADILWYDSAQGKLIFWQMENGAKQANAFLGNTTATLDGVGDFDGDGDPDILLKTSTGSVKIWTIQNLAIALSTAIGTPTSGYQVIDTGDFNGDGIDDIVMQNASGAVRIWQLDSSAQLASTINVATINTAYSLKKSGDTDNDGDDDLVFRNDTTGQTLVWVMQNGARQQQNVFSALNPQMSLATVTDFDKDGDEDLLFRDITSGNSSDGDTIIWKMQDSLKESNSFLGNIAVTYILKATLDMDGDGDFDILYRDGVTGHTAGWNMENGARVSGYNMGSPGLNWEPRF